VYGLFQQPGECPNVVPTGSGGGWFQRRELGGAGPRSDEVGVSVFLALAWAEQVAE